MAKTTVGVILPTFNRAKYIGECLDSLLGQTRPVDEIIIVNDGSTDNTLDVLASYTDPRIKVLSKENGGKPAALNYAMARCSCDYIWVCDDDDVALPTALETLARLLDENPAAGMACGRLLTFYDEDPTRALHDTTYVPRASEPDHKINFLEAMFTNQFAMLVRRSLYEKVGPFRADLLRSEDWEMILRLTRHDPVVFTPEVIFHYRQHNGFRGAASELFKAEEHSRRAQAYNEIIFAEVRAAYQLDEFCPSFARSWPASLSMRAQYLERALVYANQSIWKDTLSDLRAAAECDSGLPRCEEIALAEAVIVYDMPWDFLNKNPQWVSELRQIAQMNAYGQQIVFALCRRLYRFAAREALKKKRIISGARMVGLMLRILGPMNTLKRILATPLG